MSTKRTRLCTVREEVVKKTTGYDDNCTAIECIQIAQCHAFLAIASHLQTIDTTLSYIQHELWRGLPDYAGE